MCRSRLREEVMRCRFGGIPDWVPKARPVAVELEYTPDVRHVLHLKKGIQTQVQDYQTQNIYLYPTYNLPGYRVSSNSCIG